MKKTYIVTIVAVLVLASLGATVWGGWFQSKKTTGIADLIPEIKREQAVREVEVSIWETCNSIFYYMIDPSRISLEEYRKQLLDVEKFMLEYQSFASNGPEAQTIAAFNQHWGDTVNHAENLVTLRDQIKDLEKDLRKKTYALQHSLLNESTLVLTQTVPHLSEKQILIQRLATNIWQAAYEADFSVDHPLSNTQKHFLATAQEIEVIWDSYHKLEVSIDELTFTESLEAQCNDLIGQLRLATELGRQYRQQCLAMWESTHESDDIIDFDMQEAFKARLNSQLPNESW